MTLAQALQQTSRLFNINGIEDSHLEARILLGHMLNLSPTQIYTEPEQTLTEEHEKSLQQLIERRLRREPTAYIIKHKEFYGLDFYVDSRVLIPRPETELAVEEALKFAKDRTGYSSALGMPFLIADVGTGCGVIAISLALHLPQSKIFATDISTSALYVARLNCEYHNVTKQITLIQGHLLKPIPEPVDLIVANLPYINSSELVNLSPEIANFEPRVALDGGKGGLGQISQLLGQVEEKIKPKGCLILEIGQGQEKAIATLINRHLPKVSTEFIPDLNEIKRMVKLNF